MKKHKKYRNEPIGRIKIVNDFLPKPKDLNRFIVESSVAKARKKPLL